MTTSDLFRFFLLVKSVKSRIFQPPHLHPISFPPGRSTADSSGAPPPPTCGRAHGDAVAVVLWSTFLGGEIEGGWEVIYYTNILYRLLLNTYVYIYLWLSMFSYFGLMTCYDLELFFSKKNIFLKSNPSFRIDPL